jgi:hypothetical protein
VVFEWAKSNARQTLFRVLERRGYDIGVTTPAQRQNKRKFYTAEHESRRRYDALPTEAKLRQPAEMEAKYALAPLFGRIRVYDLIAKLGMVINPLEPELGCVSQLTHELQLASAMERDGRDPKLVLCALLHDLGTVLLNTGEDATNVEAGGKKAPLAGELGGGLHDCVFRWDHGDFIYLRMKDHVPADVAWLLRYHSMDLPLCEPYMNDDDRALTKELFVPFEYYDSRKDMYYFPDKRLEDYRALLERAFPNEIIF